MQSAPIRDQRHMVGDHLHSTVDDVVSAWRAWAANRGFRRPDGRITHDLTFTTLKSAAYISAGQWVADCPNVECNGAAAVWAENEQACCLDCGTVFAPAWPTKKQIGGSVDDAVAVLEHRAHGHWRNFRTPSNPDETIADLKAQNLAVGDAIPGGKHAKGPHPLDPSIVRR